MINRGCVFVVVFVIAATDAAAAAVAAIVLNIIHFGWAIYLESILIPSKLTWKTHIILDDKTASAVRVEQYIKE